MRPLSLLAFAPFALCAQTLVSTMPQNRTGILEEFTAINCPICPQGHVVAANLLAANPGNFIVVGVHGGGLANPSGGQPDFRTTWGTSLWSFYAVNAQPLGVMNRTNYNGQLVIGRTSWSNALSENLATPSAVNIGAATQFNAGTRELTVEVEAYYTAAGSGGNDHVQVLLTESDIIGFQASGGANYSHQHVLRAYLSPLWGDELLNSTQGTLEQRTYTFNVPLEWNIDNCHVVACVGEYQGQVHNAVEVGANNFSTGVSDRVQADAFLLFPQPATEQLFVSAPGSGALLTWEILDLNGRLMDSGTDAVVDGPLAMDVAALANGLYVLRINGRAQRFVVAR